MHLPPAPIYTELFLSSVNFVVRTTTGPPMSSSLPCCVRAGQVRVFKDCIKDKISVTYRAYQCGEYYIITSVYPVVTVEAKQ
mmetsp:Transcript_26571/g.43591  ORF Transcript_26571/g.43591 Transcript_26571/m.43591 type:complete len:82 (+) Transcript_26571:227-472(+)